ncbi:cellulose binding domain-containing protein [Micromonospora sp. WMMC415]|uniref:cellulose binding domain-containing protein n=1 Tax=Micromonospora sp. WMMC415 TaxID=2675222 RepID=UPI001E640DE5|nr:cellulose binding domain-containing protein [Micromonospora sp. WMMC415]
MKNTGTTATDSWRVTWTNPAGTAISVWNGQWIASGGRRCTSRRTATTRPSPSPGRTWRPPPSPR